MAGPMKKKFDHFIAIQITNPETVNSLKNIQQSILQRYPSYENHKIPENGFHLTLNVIALNNAAQVAKFIEAVAEQEDQIKDLCRQYNSIDLAGIGTFRHDVIFAKVQSADGVMEMNALFRSILVEKGFQTDLRPYNPHITLFKVNMSGYSNRQLTHQTLDLSDLAGVDLGPQPVNAIQVCKMGTLPNIEHGDRGFYTCVYRIEI